MIASCSSISAASTKRSPDDLPIKYPGPTKVVDQTRYSSPGDDQVPEECRGKNYCLIKPRDYPQEKFDRLFENWTNLIHQPELLPDSISNRQGDIDEKDDCKSEIAFEPIYKVRRNAMDSWKNVVNVEKKNFVQRVRTETCQNVGSSCFTSFPTIPGITTYCKQKFSMWKVPVMNDNNEIEYIDAELPVCCSCHYKVVDVEDRFGQKKPRH